MNKEFCSYKQSLALKSIGFDEPCLKFYAEGKLILGINADNGDTNSKLNQYNELFVSAPLKQQCMRWFREKYGLDNAVMKDRFVIETDEDLPKWYYGFLTYEEAEDACINKLIEICKK